MIRISTCNCCFYKHIKDIWDKHEIRATQLVVDHNPILQRDDGEYIHHKHTIYYNGKTLESIGSCRRENLKLYENQSASMRMWTFIAEIGRLKKLDFNREVWLSICHDVKGYYKDGFGRYDWLCGEYKRLDEFFGQALFDEMVSKHMVFVEVEPNVDN